MLVFLAKTKSNWMVSAQRSLAIGPSLGRGET